jgi:hypothetical protein
MARMTSYGPVAMFRKRIGSCFARKTHLLAILVVLMAVAIDVTLWGVIKVHRTMFRTLLLVLLVLLSAVEGASSEFHLVHMRWTSS